MSFNPDELCPCESGNLFRRCCQRSGCPAPAVTRPTGEKTGISNERCYASAYNNCSTKLSREHFLSESILEILDVTGNLTAAGLPWLSPGEHRSVAPSMLTGKVLCTRHNSALSSLDARFLRFFRTLLKIEEEFKDAASAQVERHYLFNGHDIERWMLKTLCGLAASGNASTDEGAVKKWKPNVTWVNMIFGTQKFPARAGLYYHVSNDASREFLKGIDIQPMFDEQNRLGLANFVVKENDLFLVMVPPPEGLRVEFLEESIYRPQRLIFRRTGSSVTKTIHFGWNDRLANGEIVIDLSL